MPNPTHGYEGKYEREKMHELDHEQGVLFTGSINH